MKRATGSILLILIIIFQFSGNDLLFHIQRCKIRREIKTRIKEGVSQEELEVFRLSLSEVENLQWHNEHEFRHNGQMYDVVREEKKGDSLYLYCINDHQETALFARLDELIKQGLNEGPGREQRQQMSIALSSLYLPASEMTMDFSLTASSKGIYLYLFRIKTWIKPPSCPPPRLIS